MVQLPIPVGPDPALPLPIQPGATIIYGSSSSALGGMWQILPDGSFVPTAANVAGDISSPNGYDLAGAPALISLGGAFRVQGPDGSTGLSVFGDNRTALYGNPILFLDRAANQFLVMTPTSLDPFGAAVGTYDLGAPGARFHNIYATNVDVTGAFTINGVPLTPGSGGPITWAMITGTPTTIAGYGITDAYTKTQSDARYAAIADGLHGMWTIGDGTTYPAGAFVPTATNTSGRVIAQNIWVYDSSSGPTGAIPAIRKIMGSLGLVFTDNTGAPGVAIFGPADGNVTAIYADQIQLGNRAETLYMLVNPTAITLQGAAIGTFNLGASSARFGTIFATTIDTGAVTASGTITATLLSGPLSWSFITNRPTTLAGYGITDAASSSGPFAWANISGKPTTIAGFGITDAFTQAQADARYDPLGGPIAWARITGTPTTLGGYGITDAFTKTQSDARYAPIGSGGGVSNLIFTDSAPSTVIAAPDATTDVGIRIWTPTNSNALGLYGDSILLSTRAAGLFMTFSATSVIPAPSGAINLGSSTQRFGTLFANAIDLPAGAAIAAAVHTLTFGPLTVPTGTPTLLFTPTAGAGTCYIISATPAPGGTAGSLLYSLGSDGVQFYLAQLKTPPANMSLTMSANGLQVNISQSTGASQTWTAFILRIA